MVPHCCHTSYVNYSKHLFMWAIVSASSRTIYFVFIVWKRCIEFSWQLWLKKYLVQQGTLSEVQNSKKDLETKVEALRTVKETVEQPEKVAKERHLKAWEGKSLTTILQHLLWIWGTTPQWSLNFLLFENVLWSTDRIVVHPKCPKLILLELIIYKKCQSIYLKYI